MGLDNQVAMEYYEAVTVIEAQDRMIEMNIADYPRMKTEGRKRFHREMRKKAYPRSLKAQKEMDFDEFFEVMGHGRRHDKHKS